jgi:hypothetical protein
MGSKREDRTMELLPMYRCRFNYRRSWSVPVSGQDVTETQHFLLAEGRCEGRIAGVLVGANHPRQRSDGTFEVDFQGVIETDDGAVIYFDHRGYGRAYPIGRRQIVGSVAHLCNDDSYRWLNDSMAVSTGEVRTTGNATELVIDVAELVWGPVEP